MLILNIIVLIFEVLYYSLFMYYSKREGKLSRYILLFSLITIILLFINSNNLYAYIIFILIELFGFKYIIKCKISLYDMFITFIMFLLKFVIEMLSFYLLNNFINNIMINATIYCVIKVLLVYFINKKINFNKIYKKFKSKWDNNIFFIRYAFIVFMFTYIIISCIYLLNINL